MNRLINVRRSLSLILRIMLKDIEIEAINRLESAESNDEILIAVEMLEEEPDTPVSHTIYAMAGCMLYDNIRFQNLSYKEYEES